MKRRNFLNIPPDTVNPTKTKDDYRHILIESSLTAGYPQEYTRHTWVFIEDAGAWLGRDSLGFYAVDATCPHLGCMVRFHENTFTCPCHRSVFSTGGSVKAGPAQHPLRFLFVELRVEGKLVIRRDHTVSPDDRFIA